MFIDRGNGSQIPLLRHEPDVNSSNQLRMFRQRYVVDRIFISRFSYFVIEQSTVCSTGVSGKRV